MKHLNLTNKVISLLSINNKELEHQFKIAAIIEEDDGAGYFANFNFEKNNVERIKNKNFPDLIGKDKDGKIILGFVLFTKDGFIDYLEGYTFGNENWPENDDDISLEIVL